MRKPKQMGFVKVPFKVRNSAKPVKQKNSGGIFGVQQALPFGSNLSYPGSADVSHVDALSMQCSRTLISNLRDTLTWAYTQIGLVATIIDVPIDDALRGGVDITTKQLSEDQIQQLQNRMDRKEDLLTAESGGKKTRLFGGGGVLILPDDQDPAEPLDLEAITNKTDVEFKAVDLWELYFGVQAAEDITFDNMYDPTASEFFNYYGHKIHKSRLLKMKGREAVSWLRPRLRGWGLSEVEILVQSINQYIKGTNLTYEVLDEFKVDWYMIEGLNNILQAPAGKEKMLRGLMELNSNKNYLSAAALDAKDRHEIKQVNFTGVAEAADGIRTQIQCDTRIPRVKLFGNGASGFSSGQDEIEVYNSMVESGPRRLMKRPLIRMIEIRCQELFGFIPDDLTVKFKPLRVLSAVDEENVKTQQFNRVQMAASSNHMSEKEYREAINKGQLLPIPLDTDEETLAAIEAMKPSVSGDGLEELSLPPKGNAELKSAPDPKKPK